MTQQVGTADVENPEESGSSWWNPRVWPAGVWLLLIGAFVMLVPFGIRMVMLAGVPAIAEPFDVAEFARWDVPANQDAFTEYRLAVGMHERITADLRLRSRTEPTNFDVVSEQGWSAADEPLKEWLELHREALTVWKKGTAKQQGMSQAPDQLTFDSILISIREMRSFVRMAMLEEERCIHEGRFDEAWRWARAANRSGGHTSYRGSLIQGLVGIAIHASSMAGMARWAERPEVTSEQLKSALADVKSDYRLYELPSNVLKAEYLALRNTLRSRSWIQFVDVPSFVDQTSPVTGVAMKMLYWVVGEPELTLRISRHVLANQLSEIDKPLRERRKLASLGLVMLFDPDPAAPRLPGQLDPARIDRAINRSLVSRSGLRATQQFDQGVLRQMAKQAAIEVLLAAQAYRRDHGEFPETLLSLVPNYLDEVPSDPFNPKGGPMLYRRDEPEKAVVWSLGSDGIDGGGNVATPTADVVSS